MKKVLSFVLVLSLVLSSFSMAFAGETKTTGLTDIAGTANEEAITVVNDLGIVTGYTDGTFKADKAVNRAEFAVMLTKALAIPESALAGYTATSFTDVAGYEWAVPYLAFCESKGIMSGYGEGIVKPGNTITVNEAMAMALRAVGYTPNSAELVGTWPSNYVTKAQELGLYADVAATLTVDRGSAAQVIYNALTVPKVSVNAEGDTYTMWNDDNKNGSHDTNESYVMLINTGLGCDYAEGIVSYGEEAIINLMPYVGAFCERYTNEDGELVAVKAKSTFLTGKFNADGDFETEDVTYRFKSNITLGTTTATAIANTAETPAQTLPVAGTATEYTIAVDVTGKTIEHVYTFATWTPNVNGVFMADADVQDDIEKNKLETLKFFTTDEDEIDLNSFALIGVKSLKDIKKDNVVYVYTNANNKILRVAVGTETVEGVVTKVNTDGEFQINGKYYANANALIAANTLTAANVSETVKVWLDAAGDVYDFEVLDGKAKNLAVVTASGGTNGYDSIIKLMDVTGTEKTYTIDSSLPTPAVGQIVKFDLDKDGVIDTMYTTTDAIANYTVGGDEGSYTLAAGEFDLETLKVVKLDTKILTVADDVTVWVYEGANPVGMTDLSLGSIGNIDRDAAATSATAVYIDENGVVVGIVIGENDADATNDDIYVVVNENNPTVNADNDRVGQIVGLANGTDFDKLTKNNTVAGTISVLPGTGNTTVTLYKVELNADGAIATANQINLYYGTGTTSKAGVTSDEAIEVSDAGKGYVVVSSTGITLAVADNVTIYEAEFDGADLAGFVPASKIKKGDFVFLAETDDDVDGFDIAIVIRK